MSLSFREKYESRVKQIKNKRSSLNVFIDYLKDENPLPTELPDIPTSLSVPNCIINFYSQYKSLHIYSTFGYTQYPNYNWFNLAHQKPKYNGFRKNFELSEDFLENIILINQQCGVDIYYNIKEERLYLMHINRDRYSDDSIKNEFIPLTISIDEFLDWNIIFLTIPNFQYLFVKDTFRFEKKICMANDILNFLFKANQVFPEWFNLMIPDSLKIIKSSIKDIDKLLHS